MHVNLFSAGHSTEEVYEALLAHQKRDGAVLKVLDLGTFGSLIAALLTTGELRVASFVALVFFGSSAVRYFIDQSNRNFFLHKLDWERAQQLEHPGMPAFPHRSIL